MNRKDIICEKDVPLLRQEIEAGVNNPWRWNWLEKTLHFIKLDSCFHKLEMPGKTYCSFCQSEIDYAHRGSIALKKHTEVKKYQFHATTRKSNYSLSCELSY